MLQDSEMRSRDIEKFISKSAWAGCIREPMTGDASTRSYHRLRDPKSNKTAILMDAPPYADQDIRPFLRIGKLLSKAGLCAPATFQADEELGLLILEDLGDDLFARVLEKQPDLESDLYIAAVDVLIRLHKEPLPKNVEPYSQQKMTELSGLAYDWYRHAALDNASKDAKTIFNTEFSATIETLFGQKQVLALRDYHAENLIWRPDQNGYARVGLLDYQDALLAHPAYDLVSLLEDARRDVQPAIVEQMITYYIDQTGADDDTFRAAYSICGAQRNLRIIGVFARLCLHYAKPGYLKLLPRVWGHLSTDLSHPSLNNLRKLISTDLPEPTPEILAKLESQCPQTR